MELEWRNQRKDLLARIDCRTGKKTRKSGNLGWFEVGFIEWRLDWKLRVQVSITEIGPGYGGEEPRPVSVPTRPGAQCFHSKDFVMVIVENDIVEIIFPIPDCINPFSKRGWGCAEGGAIHLSTGKHHCQARVEAKPPSNNSYQWTLSNSIVDKKDGINFLMSNKLIERIEYLQSMTLERARELITESGLKGVKLGGFGEHIFLEQRLRSMSEEKAREYLRKLKKDRPASNE